MEEAVCRSAPFDFLASVVMPVSVIVRGPLMGELPGYVRNSLTCAKRVEHEYEVTIRAYGIALRVPISITRGAAGAGGAAGFGETFLYGEINAGRLKARAFGRRVLKIKSSNLHEWSDSHPLVSEVKVERDLGDRWALSLALSSLVSCSC